jgi:hypothetical protein
MGIPNIIILWCYKLVWVSFLGSLGFPLELHSLRKAIA